MPEIKQLSIPVIEEHHQRVVRRVGTLDQVCCRELAEEYGKDFVLAADGGLVPACIRIERNKMGKIVMDKPRIGWKACPLCGAAFVSSTQKVIKASQ